MEVKRTVCPSCENRDRRKILEEPDKGNVLYYSMQGTPVYSMKYKCGSCGTKWDKS